jgi:hypothetical protein
MSVYRPSPGGRRQGGGDARADGDELITEISQSA